MKSTVAFEDLNEWIQALADTIAKEDMPNVDTHLSFLRHEHCINMLIDQLQAFPEDPPEDMENVYAASLLAFDICIAELQSGVEHQNKHAVKLLNQLMTYLAAAIQEKKHSLSFWLPLLSGFYEAQVELSDRLQDAYFDVAELEEDQYLPENEAEHANAMREMLAELADLSLFDRAEHFFAQSHAMPPDFFFGLVFDLLSIEEGQEVGLLFLLHPRTEVRAVVILAMAQMIETITLSSACLTRLKIISQWYPPEYQPYFERWIRTQRKKGCVYATPVEKPAALTWCATEIDGSGSQGIFIHLHEKRDYRICGLLLKAGVGVKDAWVTSILSKKEMQHYCQEAFDGRMCLRNVDETYVQMMVNHFLAVVQEKKLNPPLYLLQMTELLGVRFYPEALDAASLIQALGVQITPFTADRVAEGLKYSRRWFDDKPFMQSWFEESTQIDTYVNQCCSIVDGIKVCALEQASTLVLAYLFEENRDRWVFHFLWTALWAKAMASPRERFWKDCFLVAYALQEGYACDQIPVLEDIARLTVLNSLETMGERRSYLNLSS